jgi:hypothetical protein
MTDPCELHAQESQQLQRTPEHPSTPGECTRQAGCTLTDAEREAIERAISREIDAEWYGGPEPERVATLRGLLERTA